MRRDLRTIRERHEKCRARLRAIEDERADFIHSARAGGLSAPEIAAEVGLSASRTRAILRDRAPGASAAKTWL